ncbi:transposase [Plebeiibacterium sediminum]
MHTMNQQLKYHPHMHSIISAGGIDKNEKTRNYMVISCLM